MAGQGKRISGEIRTAVVAAVRAGATYVSAARSAGVSCGAVRMWCLAAGATSPEANGQPHPAQARALRLARQGRSDMAISRVLGVGVISVGKWRRQAKIPAARIGKTAEERAAAVCAYLKGDTLEAVGRRYGVSRECVRLWIRQAKKRTRPAHWKTSAYRQELVRALALVRAGHSGQAASRATGICPAVVIRHAKQRGHYVRSQSVWDVTRWQRSNVGRAALDLAAAGWTPEDMARVLVQQARNVERLRRNIAAVRAERRPVAP